MALVAHSWAITLPPTEAPSAESASSFHTAPVAVSISFRREQSMLKAVEPIKHRQSPASEPVVTHTPEKKQPKVTTEPNVESAAETKPLREKIPEARIAQTAGHSHSAAGHRTPVRQATYTAQLPHSCSQAGPAGHSLAGYLARRRRRTASTVSQQKFGNRCTGRGRTTGRCQLGVHALPDKWQERRIKGQGSGAIRPEKFNLPVMPATSHESDDTA